MLTCNFKDNSICSLAAYNSNELFVELKKASYSSELYCNECGSLVTFHGGPKKIYHFKHKQYCQCSYGSSRESYELLVAQRILYDHLKSNFSNYEINIDYRHENGKRSHFYIPEFNIALNLQRSHLDIAEWENKINYLDEKGIDNKWYFISEVTHSMEKASYNLPKNNIFRQIDIGEQIIIFKAEIVIDEYFKPVEITKKYPLNKFDIFRAEDLFNKFLNDEKEKRLKELESFKKEFEQKTNSKVKRVSEKKEKPLRDKLKEQEEKYSEIIRSFKTNYLENQTSKQLYEEYLNYYNKDISKIIDKLKATDIRIKAFVLKYFFKDKKDSLGYFEKYFEQGMYFLNPKDLHEIIEIKDIDISKNIAKGKIYNYYSNEIKEINIKIFKEKENGKSYSKLEFDNKKIYLKFLEIDMFSFFVQEYAQDNNFMQGSNIEEALTLF